MIALSIYLNIMFTTGKCKGAAKSGDLSDKFSLLAWFSQAIIFCMCIMRCTPHCKKYGLRDKSDISSLVLGTTGKGTHGSDIHFLLYC